MVFIVIRIKNTKRTYLAKNPLEKCQYIRQIHLFLSKIIGLQFMESNYKLNDNTLLPVCLQLYYYGFVIYTLLYYLNEPSKALIVTPMMGFFIPVSFFSNILFSAINVIEERINAPNISN